MKNKKDIFNGKIKREYFSYILVYMIFFVLLSVIAGALCIYASVWRMTANALWERLLIGFLGIIALLFAGIYAFLEMLVIRRFPKHEKIRRILFNSDCYFTDSRSDAYFDENISIRGRMSKTAFDAVTAFAEAEKEMGDKKPIRYKIYIALAIVMSILGIIDTIALPMLYEKSAVLSKMPEENFAFCYIFIAVACLAFAFFFLARAFKLAKNTLREKDKWKNELYFSLIAISIRQNNKKLKFWYSEAQLEQIEKMVKSASENAGFALETKGDKPVSFSVTDMRNNRVIFTGFFK